LRLTGKRTRAAGRSWRAVSEGSLWGACVGAHPEAGKPKPGHQEITAMNRFGFQSVAILTATVLMTVPIQAQPREGFRDMDVLMMAGQVPAEYPAWIITVADAQPPQIDVGRYSNLAIPTEGDQRGIPRIAYYNWNYNYGIGALKYGWWYVAGSLWRHSMLDYSADVGQACSLACWPDGSLMCITYFDDTHGWLKAALWDEDVGWWTETWWTLLPGDYHRGEATSVKFLPSGEPVAVFHGRTGWPPNLPQWGLLYRHANGEVTVVDTGRWAGFRCSLAIDPDNDLPGIAYTEGDWGALRYAWMDEDGYRHIENAVYRDDVGWHCSLKFFPPDHPEETLRGEPAIAYHDGQTGCLHFAWREGGVWHHTLDENPVDGDPFARADVGTFPSLAILLSGHPAISYAKNGPGGEEDPQELRYVRHAGPNFDFTSGWNPPQTVDDGGVGSYTSLALLPGGTPAISYYDKTNGDLKYARQNLCLPQER
jgi:hypothetical protein